MSVAMARTMALLAAVVAMNAAAWTNPDDRPDSAVSQPVPPPMPAQPAAQEVRRVSLDIRGTDSREWSRFGLDDTELAAAIAERLAKSGIEVVAASTDAPILEIDAHVNDQTVNNSYIVYIRLKDRLRLPQNPDGFVTRTVWSDWKLGAFEPHNYRKLRAAILELVDVFAGQHLLSR